MPDPVVSGTPAVPPAAPGTAIQTPPAVVQAPEYITKEEFKIVTDRLQGISGVLATLKREAPPAVQVTPAPDATLIERVKSIEDRDAKQREREKLSTIKTALIEGGVPAKKAEREARLILMDHGSKIQVGDDFSVTYRESEDGKANSVQDWISAYLKTDDGKLLLPAKATIDAGGSGSSTTAAPATHPMSGMTWKQIMEGRADLRASFLKQFPDLAKAKEQEYLAGKR